MLCALHCFGKLPKEHRLDVAMQKIVVQMKDELEKIKEQLLNIL